MESPEREPGVRGCQGPANWFFLPLPASFRIQQSDSLIRVTPVEPGETGINKSHETGDSMSDADLTRPAATDWTATICSTWVPETNTSEEGAERRDSERGLVALFPEVRQRRAVPGLRGDIASDSWEGISRPVRRGPWWKRILQRHPDYEWRFWLIRHHQVRIVICLQSRPGTGLPREVVAQWEHLLEGIELPDQPLWSPQVFAQRVTELARRHFPLLEVGAGRGFSVMLAGSTVELLNYYRRYLLAPGEFEQFMLPGLTAIVRMQELGPDQILPPLSEVRNQLLPVLSVAKDDSDAPFLTTPWIGGLDISYVIDEAETYRFIHDGLLDRWGISQEKLHDLAMENLDALLAREPIEVTVVGEADTPSLLMPTEPNAYNSSRILAASFHDRLRSLFGPEVILGVPNRDFFVAVTPRDPDLIEQVRDRVIQDHGSMHHPLTSRLLVISADGVSEFCGGYD